VERTASAFAAVNGRVAGIVDAGQGKTHAFLLEGDKLEDLGTLGGAAAIRLPSAKTGSWSARRRSTAGRCTRSCGAPVSRCATWGCPKAGAPVRRGVSIRRGGSSGNVVDMDGVARAVAFDPDTGRISSMPLPTDVAGRPYKSARLVGIAPDGRAFGRRGRAR